MLTAVDFGSSEAARHHRRVWVVSTHSQCYYRSRPIPGADGAEMIATKRPFAACVKLTLPLDESSQNTGSARV